ncbi:MAG: DUF3343 domain-containing protein [Lachnospiraceae bacterium]|nr:DUF3343 domain-containing protein [Lachnospiraceae bacterium]
MRVKKEQLVISFASTAHAMAVEAFCMERELPGRLIPIPKEISAGCGLAWKANPEDEQVLLDAFKKEDISYQGVHKVVI